MSTLTHLQDLTSAHAEHFPDGATGAFATVDMRDQQHNTVRIFIRSRAAADELINAALSARDSLPEDEGEHAPEPGCDETCPDTTAHRALTGVPAASGS